MRKKVFCLVFVFIFCLSSSLSFAQFFDSYAYDDFSDISVINTQSYPYVNGNWTVQFKTYGVYDLKITAVNGTVFGVDLDVLDIRCLDKSFDYVTYENSVFVKDYFCDSEGYFVSKVSTQGKHDLEFIFGYDMDYAHNLATLSSCGTLSTANEVYVLNQNVNSAGTCFTIIANNVTLDCNGYTISYSQSSTGYGIDNSGGYNSVNVKNCNIIQGGDYDNSYGIYYVNSVNGNGFNGAVLGKYGRSYRGIVDHSGQMRIEELLDNEWVVLAAGDMEAGRSRGMVLFKFMNVDHQLILEFGGRKVKYDLGRGSKDAGQKKMGILPEVKIVGAGKLKLSHMGVFRDIYYMDEDAERAREGEAFSLGEDEYFVCGDNSPISQDARVWGMDGVGNNGKVYRKGTVPRDYLVGKAFFVYWSEAFRPFENLLPVIPNVGQIGFIYGGSDAEL